MVCCLDEPVSVVPEGMALQHLQHFGTSMLDDGDACEKYRSDVERQDRPFGRGWNRYLFCDDVVEIGNDDAENSVSPEFGVVREWQGNPAHQQKAGQFQRGGPGLDTAFGIIVEQLLAAKLGATI